MTYINRIKVEFKYVKEFEPEPLIIILIESKWNLNAYDSSQINCRSLY